jgi:hypothetical protein
MKNFLNLILYAIYLHRQNEGNSKGSYFRAKLYFLLLLFFYLLPVLLFISLFLEGNLQNPLFKSRIALFLFMLPFYFLLSRFTMNYETMINHQFSDEEIARGNDWLGMLIFIAVVLFMISTSIYGFVKYRQGMCTNTSYIDKTGGNTGFWKSSQLVENTGNSGTHELGHQLGLSHPADNTPCCLEPSIMLTEPNNRQVDAEYTKTLNDGTKVFDVSKRKVTQQDIQNIGLPKLNFVNGKANIGNLTNVYHEPTKK